jgi:hypothetical protein
LQCGKETAWQEKQDVLQRQKRGRDAKTRQAANQNAATFTRKNSIKLLQLAKKGSG